MVMFEGPLDRAQDDAGEERSPQEHEAFVAPASYAQQRLWFLDRLEPESTAYNLPLVLRLSGDLDVAALEQALSDLVERHEALRTTFFEKDGEVYQAVQRAERVALVTVDLDGEEDPEGAAMRLAAEEVGRHFDLGSRPPFRACVLRLGEHDELLVLTLHHIAADGWSMRILRRDLSELYSAARESRPAVLPELPVQYADFAVWQREWLADERLQELLDYWRGQLAGAPAVLALPTDRPRPPVQTYRGAHRRRILPAALADALRAIARENDATLFMTLLAAFSALLARYSAQEDVVVAAPIANRGRVELEELIGFFANTLALRIDVAGDPTFRELLGRTKQTALGAYDHEDLPFEKLVAELNPQRELSHAPVSQVLFSIVQPSSVAREFGGLESTNVNLERGTAKFDLALFVTDTADGLLASFEYATDLFDGETIERMLGHFETLLVAVAAEPDRPLSRLPLLTQEERSLFAAWNATERHREEAGRCVHELVEAQVARTPAAPAVSFAGTTLSYAELNGRADLLAGRLRTAGVGPDVAVAICAERSLEVMVAMLAIAKAGGAIAPLDPAYPQERLAYMLSDLAPPVLLTQRGLAAQLPDQGAQLIFLDEVEWSDAPAVDLDDHSVRPENLFYILYTSGSTGRPKGVAMPHATLANLIAWQLDSWVPPAPARTVQFAPLSFDVAFQEVFATWSAGGTLVLVDEDTRRDPRALLALLDEERVERLYLPYVALQHLAETAEQIDRLPGGLREVITAGEALLVTPAIRAFFERLDGCVLHNQYGPTETHVVTQLTLDGPPGAWPGRPTIGRPISNARVHLLDSRGNEVPVGVPGELVVAGHVLARGYLNRPELTDERFIPDEFAPTDGGRMYRTGDLARYLPDGQIDYLGRADSQTKIRGYRVELGEVEAVLLEHPDVRDAAVVARDDESRGRQLVAYVVCSDSSTGDILRFLQQRLPPFMVPSAIVPLAALPLTASGKIDRRSLPEPLYERSGHVHVPAQTLSEELVATIFEDVLGLDRVGVDDNFFELGGHSLLATRVISRVLTQAGVELPLRSLFEHPTVRGLAARIDHERSRETAKGAALAPTPREGPLPCSFAQERLWFLDHLEQASGAYNLALLLRVRGDLDEAVLERALTQLVERYEVLRTAFVDLDGAPRQLIRPPKRVRVELADVSSEPDAEQAMTRLAAAWAGQRFDLATGRLLRAGLIRRASEDHLLVLTLHHIVTDGWSMGVLERDLRELYAAALDDRPPALPPLPVQYADFAVWQREWLDDARLQEHLSFWRSQLQGAPDVLELPMDRPRPAVQSYRGSHCQRVFPPALLEQLRELGRSEGATLFMTVFAAFSTLLSRYSGQDDIVVATPIANRNRAELDELIGFFVNTLLVRVDLGGDPTFSELLARIREATLAAYDHQDLPFERLIAELNPKRQLSHAPIAQVLFGLQHADGPALELPGLETSRVQLERGTTKLDLSLYCVDRPDGLAAGFEYSSDIFDATTVERMLEHLETLLGAVVASPGLRVSELPLVPAGERQRLVEAAAATAEFPVGCLHELFVAQAQRTPDAPALTFEGTTLSYRELDGRANALAHRLRELGVGRESLVALYLERSLELVVTVLAVLKAGGAYVPLDPQYPADRIAYILEDTQAPVLVTQRALLDRIPPHQAATVCVEDEDGLREDAPATGSQSHDLAYVIYTSGSTGRPKGVQVEHRNVARLLTATDPWFSFSPNDTWLLFHSYAFDFSVWELWGPLLHGGRLVVPPHLTTRSPQLLAGLLVAERVTVMNATPSLFQVALEELLAAADELSLRLVVFGGEALRPMTLRPWFERFGDGGPELVNMYGITETTVHVTYRPVTAADARADISPIGGPIPDLALYVLDSQLEVVPVGVPGELYVGGAGVARGYLNRPELTAERFVENPFGAGRLYRTGDRARRRADGELEFLGRVDHQVKIRGFRIELGEIEAALNQHPAVGECVVRALEVAPGDTRLAGYVVPVAAARADDPDVLRAQLRAGLERELPPYMVPASITLIETLPLTPNGKLDVGALPEPSGERPELEHEYAPPETKTEEVLTEIYAELLGLDRVGRHDDFFELGGHSLLAVRLFTLMERRLRVRLSLAILFQGATPAELAAAVEEERHATAPWSSLVLLRPGEAEPPLFLVHVLNGELLKYRDLVARLEIDNPVYGLQAVGLDGRMPPRATIEEMAAGYVEELRRLQPRGPYMLGGLCFAGVVAYEMARQLDELGEETKLLVMIESGPFKAMPVRGTKSRLELEREKFGRLLRSDRRGKAEWFAHRAKGLKDKIHLKTGRFVYDYCSRRNRPLPKRPWNMVFVANVLAIERAVTPATSARVTLIRAQDAAGAPRETAWTRLAGGGVNVRPIVARGINHVNIAKDPYVGLLAAEMTDLVRSVSSSPADEDVLLAAETA